MDANTTSETTTEVKPTPSAALNVPGLENPHWRDQDVKFSFKSRKKEGDKDDTGVAGEGPEKRATVNLVLPVLTFEGLVEKIVSAEDTEENKGLGTKLKNLIVEQINELIIAAARDQVNDEETPVNRQDELDFSKLTLEYIAMQPKSERTGGGISKETWADFEKDYITVMVPATGKELKRIAKAAEVFVKRLNPAKGDKKVLTHLQGQLALWAANTTALEEFQEVHQFLDQKLSTWLTKDDSSLLNAL